MVSYFLGFSTLAKGPCRAAQICLLGLLFLSSGCADKPVETKGAGGSMENSGEAGVPTFSEAQEIAGIDFRHDHGGVGERYMPETMGSGAAWLDFDDDGHFDLFLVQSGPFPGAEPSPGAASTGQASGDQGPGSRLFHNLGDGTFEDVTEASGAISRGYGMGACVGDVDNDGDPDLYLSHYGPDQLLRNLGDGTFEDATEAADIDVPGWSTSCTFVDIDRDGWLDLYVVRYVDFRIDNHRSCGPVDLEQYCHPDVYDGVSDVLLRNLGDGKFEDITQRAGVGVDDPTESKGLGVLVLDHDRDGDPDLYISNDSTRNFLYRNDGEGRFEEIGTSVGVAFNELGVTEAGMGVDVGDVDGDGLLDLFVTNLDFETNTLYRQVGGGLFEDSTVISGLSSASIQWVGFGVAFFDADLDADLDLYITNGHILDNVRARNPTLSYAQPDQFFLNGIDGEAGRFTEVSERAGESFRHQRVGRGVADADYDNDGDIDLVISHSHQEAVLLRNDLDTDPGEESWIGLRLRSRFGGRDAYGAEARLTLKTPDGERTLIRQVQSGGGYLTQGDPRAHFGLGRGNEIERVEIRWPEGDLQTVAAEQLRAGTYQDIHQPGESTNPEVAP